MNALSIVLSASTDDLVSASGSSPKSPHVVMAVKLDPRLPHSKYLSLPLELFGDQGAVRLARETLREIQHTLDGIPAEEKLGEFKNWLKRRPPGKSRGIYSGPRNANLWSLMLIDWVFQVGPKAFLSGRQSLSDAFAEYLGLDFRPPSGERTLFEKLIVDQGATRYDRRIQLQMERQHRERLASLGRIADMYEGFGKIFLLASGFFVGGTGVFVLTVFLEAFIGYIQFMSDLYEFEKDGVITTEENLGAWISLVGVFLPFGAYLGRAIHNALGSAIEFGLGALSIAAVAYGFLIAIVQGLIEIWERLQRMLAATEVGFRDYAEVDPERVVLIPRSAG